MSRGTWVVPVLRCAARPMLTDAYSATIAAEESHAEFLFFPQTFQSIAKEIMIRLSAQQDQGSPARGGGSTVRMDGGYAAAAAKKKAACCST